MSASTLSKYPMHCSLKLLVSYSSIFCRDRNERTAIWMDDSMQGGVLSAGIFHFPFPLISGSTLLSLHTLDPSITRFGWW